MVCSPLLTPPAERYRPTAATSKTRQGDTGRGRSPMAGRRFHINPAPHNNGTTQQRQGVQGEACHEGSPSRPSADAGRWVRKPVGGPEAAPPPGARDPQGAAHSAHWARGGHGAAGSGPVQQKAPVPTGTDKIRRQTKSVADKRQGPSPAGRSPRRPKAKPSAEEAACAQRIGPCPGAQKMTRQNLTMDRQVPFYRDITILLSPCTGCANLDFFGY